MSPATPGLVGLTAWFWLEPAPLPVTSYETIGGVDYRVVAQPDAADWDFGDGGALRSAGFGIPYPSESNIRHSYEAQSAGYPVSAAVHYTVSWWWRSGSGWLGPYPLGSQTVPARAHRYAVRQAQPELEATA